MNLARFRRKPLLGILRGISQKSLEPLFEAIVKSGLETVEITMNTEGAASLIKKAVRLYEKQLMIGAGTVLTVKDLKMAIQSGATFIVMPVIVKPVIAYYVKHKIPVFPGALAPQDIYEAWELGATMVKVFPASCFGPVYFKEIKGPFQDIELMACSGVTPENINAYIENGASAASIGSGTFRKEWIENRKFDLIQERIQSYLKALKN